MGRRGQVSAGKESTRYNKKIRGRKMKLYDVTVGISETMPIYAGDPTVSISAAKSIAGGDSANVSQLSLGVHSGTHVDAPNHFIDGTRRIHELDPNKLIGPCRVVQVPEDI